MDAKKNFQTAVKELLGTKDGAEEKGVNGESSKNIKETKQPRSPVPNLSASSEAKPGVKEMQTSTISADTVIQGQISTEGNLIIAGTVKGDISAKGFVKISGKTIGNINGDSVELNSSRIKGNIKAVSRTVIDNGSEIVGDINSKELSLDGKVKGNVIVEKEATLLRNSLILGNLSTFTLSIENGATLSGEIRTLNGKDKGVFEKELE